MEIPQSCQDISTHLVNLILNRGELSPREMDIRIRLMGIHAIIQLIHLPIELGQNKESDPTHDWRQKPQPFKSVSHQNRPAPKEIPELHVVLSVTEKCTSDSARL